MKKEIHQENRLLPICIVCETIAYLLALLFRYVVLNPLFPNQTREYNFYKMFYFIVIFAYGLIFMFRRRRRPPTWEQGGWSKLAEVIKQHITLLICLVIFLYFIHWSDRVSRTVMGFLVALGMLLDLTWRVQYGRARARRYIRDRREEQVLLLAGEDEAERLEWSLNRYGYHNGEKDIQVRCRVAERVILHPGEDAKSALEKKLQGEPPYEMIYFSAAAAAAFGQEAIKEIEKYGIPIACGLEMDGMELSASGVVGLGGSAAVYQSLMTRKCPVLGVEYTTAGRSEAAGYLIRHSGELGGKYICFSNVHTTVMAADDPEYREILNASAITFPDGNPIANKIWEQGFPEAERVAGPDLMEELFRRGMGSGKKHYFYGSTEKTLQALKEKLAENYPWMEVVGMYSPPFRPLTEEEDAQIIKQINDSGADFVWIGLGAPKQEKWMSAHVDKIHGVMLGVGAGFDFHAGTVKRAPLLIQKIGMEWLYRLFQDPGRLFKRYLITNTKFILYCAGRGGGR